MDELTTLATAWKELTPWALGVLLVALIVYRVFPYLQERVRKQTKELEIAAEQNQAESQQENVWLSIFEKQTAIQDRHLKLLDDIERRSQERHQRSMDVMMGVKSERDQKIDALPARIVEAQSPALVALETNLMARLDILERNIPDAMRGAVQADLTAIKEQVSQLTELVKKGKEDNGQQSMGNSLAVGDTGDLGTGEPDGDVQLKTGSAGCVSVAEASTTAAVVGGSADRHDPAADQPSGIAA